MLKNIRVRLILKCSLILVALLSITLTGIVGWHAYNRHKSADRLSNLNDMANKIIEAAAYHALERGTAATALGSAGTADSEAILRIQHFRKKGDASFLDAISIAQEIAGKKPGSQFASAVEQTKHAYESLAAIRDRVDNNLKLHNMDVQLILEWFTAMTNLIDEAARLRLTAFYPSDTLNQIQLDNLILKDAIWLISENMGRERGTLGPLIAAGKPVPHDMQENLNAYHELVRMNISKIVAIKEATGTDNRIAKAIGAMEKGLKQFDTLRSEVYSAAGSGHYPLNAYEWMSRSTEAINTVLAVSDKLTEVSNEKASKVAGESFKELVIAITLICLTVIFTSAVVMLVYGNVCSIGHFCRCEPIRQTARNGED